MRESMARLTPHFSANRTMREYTEKYYIPAAESYRERSADNGAICKMLVDWKRELERNWQDLRFGTLSVTTNGERHVFDVQVYFGNLNPDLRSWNCLPMEWTTLDRCAGKCFAAGSCQSKMASFTPPWCPRTGRQRTTRRAWFQTSREQWSRSLSRQLKSFGTTNKNRSSYAVSFKLFI